MIRMRLQILPPGARLDEVVSALRVLISRTQVRLGCLDCHLSVDEQEKERLNYEETWKDWSSLDQYIRSESYRTILELMEISTSSPVLQFEEPGIIRGIEYVEKIRKG